MEIRGQKINNTNNSGLKMYGFPGMSPGFMGLIHGKESGDTGVFLYFDAIDPILSKLAPEHLKIVIAEYITRCENGELKEQRIQASPFANQVAEITDILIEKLINSNEGKDADGSTDKGSDEK